MNILKYFILFAFMNLFHHFSYSSGALYKSGSKIYDNEIYLYFNYCTDTDGIVIKFWDINNLKYSVSRFIVENETITIESNEEPFYNVKIFSVPIRETLPNDSIYKYFIAYNPIQKSYYEFFTMDIDIHWFHITNEIGLFKKDVYELDSLPYSDKILTYKNGQITKNYRTIADSIKNFSLYGHQYLKNNESFYLTQKYPGSNLTYNILYEKQFRFITKGDENEIFIFYLFEFEDYFKVGQYGGYQPYKSEHNDMIFDILSPEKLLSYNNIGYRKTNRIPKKIKNFLKLNSINKGVFCDFFMP